MMFGKRKRSREENVCYCWNRQSQCSYLQTEYILYKFFTFLLKVKLKLLSTCQSLSPIHFCVIPKQIAVIERPLVRFCQTGKDELFPHNLSAPIRSWNQSQSIVTHSTDDGPPLATGTHRSIFPVYILISDTPLLCFLIFFHAPLEAPAGYIYWHSTGWCGPPQCVWPSDQQSKLSDPLHTGWPPKYEAQCIWWMLQSRKWEYITSSTHLAAAIRSLSTTCSFHGT